MKQVFIGMGSNMGDRLANLNNAVKLMSQECKISRASSVFETEPEGDEKQPDFLNCVVEVETGLRPVELLDELKSIEKMMGRKKSFRNAPRPIDLDILFFGSNVIKTPELEIPHPQLQGRPFVLVPMVQIASQFEHPTLHKTIQQLLLEINVDKRVEKWGELSIEAVRS